MEELPRLVVSKSLVGNGTQCTARLGDKWIKNFAHGQDRVAVVTRKGKALGVASIIALAYAPFDSFNPSYFTDDWQPDDPADYVTVLWFQMENLIG